MARKGRESLTEAPPPAASSSEDNDSDSDSDEYESSSEDEADHQTPLPQQPLKKPDPPIKPQVSESDSDIDTDSDSDPNPTPSEPPKSKPTASLPTPHVTAVSNKRKSTNADSSDKVATPKKVKKEKSGSSGSTPVPDDGPKKPMFQRLWSDDDEIAILKGLIEFKAKKGKDPMSDVDGFIDFIKNSLHVAVVKKEQIVSKVRRLKVRYQNAKKRTLTNPHELNAFVLSKSIWGGSDDEIGVDENDNGMSAKSPSSKSKSKSKESNVKSKAVKNVAANGGVLIDGGKKDENRDEKIKSDEGNVASGGDVVMRMSVSHGIQLAELNKFGNVDEKFMNEGLKLLDDAERDALEEEWRNFNVAQMERLVKRLELYQKTAKCLLNAVKSTKH